jgi:hypothetical protein
LTSGKRTGGKALLFHLMVKRGFQVILKGLGKDVGGADIYSRAWIWRLSMKGQKNFYPYSMRFPRKMIPSKGRLTKNMW